MIKGQGETLLYEMQLKYSYSDILLEQLGRAIRHKKTAHQMTGGLRVIFN